MELDSGIYELKMECELIVLCRRDLTNQAAGPVIMVRSLSRS